jgi:hypothetical protein
VVPEPDVFYCVSFSSFLFFIPVLLTPSLLFIHPYSHPLHSSSFSCTTIHCSPSQLSFLPILIHSFPCPHLPLPYSLECGSALHSCLFFSFPWFRCYQQLSFMFSFSEPALTAVREWGNASLNWFMLRKGNDKGALEHQDLEGGLKGGHTVVRSTK